MSCNMETVDRKKYLVLRSATKNYIKQGNHVERILEIVK